MKFLELNVKKSKVFEEEILKVREASSKISNCLGLPEDYFEFKEYFLKSCYESRRFKFITVRLFLIKEIDPILSREVGTYRQGYYLEDIYRTFIYDKKNKEIIFSNNILRLNNKTINHYILFIEDKKRKKLIDNILKEKSEYNLVELLKKLYANLYVNFVFESDDLFRFLIDNDLYCFLNSKNSNNSEFLMFFNFKKKEYNQFDYIKIITENSEIKKFDILTIYNEVSLTMYEISLIKKLLISLTYEDIHNSFNINKQNNIHIIKLIKFRPAKFNNNIIEYRKLFSKEIFNTKKYSNYLIELDHFNNDYEYLKNKFKKYSNNINQIISKRILNSVHNILLYLISLNTPILKLDGFESLWIPIIKKRTKKICNKIL